MMMRSTSLRAHASLLCRYAENSLLFLFIAMSSASAQTPIVTPAFEVAAIRQTSLLQAGIIRNPGMTIDRARVDIQWESLGDLIAVAYKIKPFQIAGPDWLAAELKEPFRARHFDIRAKLPEGAAADQVPEMLKTLLAVRFGMTAHWEKRETPVYALVVGKDGPKMKPGVAEVAPPTEGTSTVATVSGERQVVRNNGRGQGSNAWATGLGVWTFGSNGIHIEASNLSIARLPEIITDYVGKPVVDETGLKGGYQVVIDIPFDEWRAVLLASGAPTLRQDTPPELDPRGSAWFQTVERLGLKLESQKDAVDTLVVDRIEKMPTEN
jgi:uncharacterized protein (TIGR03435 family)